MAAVRLHRSLTAYYSLSLDAKDVGRDSPHYIGKLRAADRGSDWTLCNRRRSPTGHGQDAHEAVTR